MWQNRISSYSRHHLGAIISCALIYFVLAKISFIYDFRHSGYSPIWLPEGFALAMVLMAGESLVLAVGVGAFLAYASVFSQSGMANGAWVGLAASLSLVNALQAVVGARLLKKFLSQTYPLFKVSDVLIFVGVASLIAGVGTVLGTEFLCAYHIAPREFYQSVVVNWWWSELAGILTVAPLVWIFFKVPFKIDKLRYRIEALLWLCALMVVVFIIFGGKVMISQANMPVSFLLIPLMVWFTYRLGHWAAMSSVVILMAASVYGTTYGFGPFVQGDVEPSLLLMRSFNAVAAVTTLTLAAALFERQQAQLELARSHQRFKSLTENSTDALQLLSAQGLILFVSNSIRRLMGYQPDEMMGRSVFDFIFQEDRVGIEESFAQVLKSPGEVISMQCRMRRKDGLVRWFEGTTQNLLNDQTMKAIVVNFRDITERKMAEDILKVDKISLERLVEERSEALAETQKELRHASRLADIGTLAATVAHELRNPLGVIQMAAHNIKRKNRRLNKDHHLQNIEKKVWEGNQIIDNLLSYSRIKMPSFVRVNALELLDECLHHAQARFIEGDVKVNCSNNVRGRVMIEADPHQLREIFSNVLNNAFQALQGFPTGQIQISIDQEIDKIRFTISDTGSGIDEEDIPKVFNPFFTRKAKGTGLGLSICNEIVSLHHGRIEITSQKNAGTSVSIILPIQQSHFTTVTK